jgi:unsaturated rhamnogalacturonyl hydrolase
MVKKLFILNVLVVCIWVSDRSFVFAQKLPSKAEVLKTISLVNDYWQSQNSPYTRAFWDNAAYHVGNMEAFAVTGNEKYFQYSLAWADSNKWKGAKSDIKENWKYNKYGESDDFVMFGDWQACFQVYLSIYNIKKDETMIARVREVMEYQMSTSNNDYWWWADGLFMVMPLMPRLYQVTKNNLYLDKLYSYYLHADSIMYDKDAGLYYRDAKYVYPKHKSVNGKKDFWARGDGWVLAALTRVLEVLPKNDPHRDFYLSRYIALANSIKSCQQPDGYWTRSLLDPEHAPGPETSGTAFYTYGILWGINNKILDRKAFLPVIKKSWNYLTTVALQPSGKLGYVQPIGERAIPGQTVDANSTANFGVGAFLLAASELTRMKE